MDYVREAIEYLRSYNDLKSALENLGCEVRELRAMFPGDKAMVISSEPHGSGGSGMDDAVLNKLYKLKKAEEEYSSTKHKIKQIDSILKQLSNKPGYELHEQVLRMWFIENMRAEDIAVRVNVSERHVFRIKNIAIRRLAVLLFGIAVID
jgi:DNA-directed RNA polymerase specialized sigma subunit